MNVIGHRGAAGLAPENSAESIRAGIKAGVDGIEFDVRATKDGKIVLIHDDNLQRTHGVDLRIAAFNLKEAQDRLGVGGKSIITLEEALAITKETPVYIEGKGHGWATPLAKLLQKHPSKKFCNVIAFNHHELFTFGQKCSGVPLYALENHNPMDALNAARIFGFEGIDLNYWILNPLVYWLCRRHKLNIIVFTVNKPWMAQFLRIFYPGISITTDVPQLMQFLRRKEKTQ